MKLTLTKLGLTMGLKRTAKTAQNNRLGGGAVVPAGRTAHPVRAPNTRSRVSNGKQLFVELRNGDSAWARRLKDLMADHASDLGGADAISAAEQALIRRCAMLAVQLEMMEQRWAAKGGEAGLKELEVYQRTTGGLRRVLQTLGLHRRPRDVTPSLSEYLRSKQIEYEEAAE